MIITKIEEQKKNKDRLSLFLCEEFFSGINVQTFIEFGLKTGMDVDENFLKEMIDYDNQLSAKKMAFNIIAKGSLKTEKEVKEKILSKGYSEECAVGAVEILKEYKYINDEYFCECFIKDKLNLNGFGRKRIIQELRRKGVDPDTISSAMDEFMLEDEELEKAIALGRKKVNVSKITKENLYKKITPYLSSKGYSYDIIKKVIDELKKDF